MKLNKISLKLSIYFSLALLFLAVILSVTFMKLFEQHTIKITQDNMVERSSKIAAIISPLLQEKDNKLSDNSKHMNKKEGNGLGSYLNFISSIETSDVWIVDSNKELVTTKQKHSQSTKSPTYKELPVDATNIIDNVMNNKVTTTKKFSGYLKESTLTVGVPILDEQNKVIGAVLVHSPINGINDANKQGQTILIISLLVGLAAALILSSVLSQRFTKPLKDINNATLALSQNEYSTRLTTKQNDEIGTIALSINHLASLLEQAEENNNRLDELRNDFIANISHELKTPITVIKSYIQAIQDGVIKEDEIDDANKQIHQEILFLETLVQDLLDLSIVQNPGFSFIKSDVNLNDIIKDVYRNMNRVAEKKQVEINLKLSEDIYIIQGDYVRLKQMFMIILDNAIKYSPKNSIVDFIVDDETVIIKDQGMGIAKEDIDHIFERFYFKRDESNKTGTGLGLSIAQEIAKKHGMVIEVENNDGAQFTIYYKEKL